MNQVISFDQLPQMVSDLTHEVKLLKAMVLQLFPSGSTIDDSGTIFIPSNHSSVSDTPIYKHVLCDVSRAMEITKKSRSTIYRLVRHGAMPGMKKGKQLYFYEDELAAWIETGRRQCNMDFDHEATLRKIQSGMRHKPGSLYKKGV